MFVYLFVCICVFFFLLVYLFIPKLLEFDAIDIYLLNHGKKIIFQIKLDLEASPSKKPEAPKITKELEEVEVDEGKPAELYLQFVSEGKTTVVWMKDGHPVTQNKRVKVTTDDKSSKLRITETDIDEDEGLYICYVTNEAGEVNTSAELLVEGKLNIIPARHFFGIEEH